MLKAFAVTSMNVILTSSPAGTLSNSTCLTSPGEWNDSAFVRIHSARLRGQTERNALRGRALFDLLTAYKKMHLSQKESYRLDAVALEEVGEQKVRYTGTISDLWKNSQHSLLNIISKTSNSASRSIKKTTSLSSTGRLPVM